MSEIKQGNIVKVLDNGETYTTYTELFEHAKRLSGTDFHHAYDEVPVEDDTYRVISVVHHFDSGRPIAMIHNNNKYAFLIGVKGLELI